MEFREIPIDRVLVNNRLRQPQEESIQALAESIESIGLLNPVVVKASTKTDSGTAEETFCMVAGVRRLFACKHLGYTSIPARIFLGTEIDDRLAEIDENLCRAELSELEKSEHLAEKKELYEVKHPETRHGGAPGKAGGGKKAKTDNLSTFATDTAQKTGVTDRDIRRSIRRAEKIPNEVKDMIINTEIANKGVELDALAKMDPKEQKAAVQAVIDGRSSTIREAASTLNSTTDSQSEKTTNTTDVKQTRQRKPKKDEGASTKATTPKNKKAQDQLIASLQGKAVPELLTEVKAGRIKGQIAKRIATLSDVEQRFVVQNIENLPGPAEAQRNTTDHNRITWDRSGNRHHPKQEAIPPDFTFPLMEDKQRFLDAAELLSEISTPPDLLGFNMSNAEMPPPDGKGLIDNFTEFASFFIRYNQV